MREPHEVSIKLENQNGSWLYSSKKWDVPEKGKKGVIKDQVTGKVLSINSYMNVDLQDKKDLIGKIQCMWTRSKADSDGWFRLTIRFREPMHLSASSKSRLIMAGL